MCVVPDGSGISGNINRPCFRERTGHQLVDMFQFKKRSLHEMKADSFIVLAFLSIAPSRWFKVFLACLVLN